jgi:hypothetical protein
LNACASVRHRLVVGEGCQGDSQLRTAPQWETCAQIEARIARALAEKHVPMTILQADIRTCYRSDPHPSFILEKGRIRGRNRE